MSGLADLSGRGAVVTGGASGIGLGIAEALLEAGARVMIADVDADALAIASKRLDSPAFQVDVRDGASVAALAEAATAHLGLVHIICNNAGIGPAGRIDGLSAEDWRWMLDVNLWGVIHGIDSFLPLLRAHGEGGHIVNTASMSGLAPAAGLGAYSVSKFGVVALTEALAAELASGGEPIGTTVLCPGPVRSRISDSARLRPGDTSANGLTDLNLETAGIFGAAGPPWIDPLEAGRIVVDAIREGALYAITHPQLFARVKARHAEIEAAFERAAARKAP